MPTEQEVYQQHAEQYERLIQREDYQNHILRAVEQICPLKGLDVIDLGAGTGRVTRILAPRVNTIRAYDSSAHMLSKAQSSLHAMGMTNWQAGVADHRRTRDEGEYARQRPGEGSEPGVQLCGGDADHVGRRLVVFSLSSRECR